VLRNNYWLTLHVATTLLGFGALAVAAGLAHYAWCVYCFREKKAELFNSLSAAVWRVMRAGVVLLALGTVMGGFWASESWGRFWGWDAKESWALITILVYVIILHARGCGWLREFGVVMGAIWGFLAVLMTWYGVNYLLGTGRHSYGFGRGGAAVALVVLAAECLVVITAMSLRSSRAAAEQRGSEAR
jgi:ABC-type transport system involved in cytochrome c biogenesis permease subunit